MPAWVMSVPKEVCDILGIDKDAEVELVIATQSGTHGPVRRRLYSDRQPSPPGEMEGWMTSHERIRVLVRLT